MTVAADRASGSFTGTRHLVRLILRRDRIRLPLWVVGLTAMIGASANAVQEFYDTPVRIAGYGATVVDSAVARLMGGIPYDIGTIGGITAYEVTAVAGIGAALMVTFLVVRHTRGEEESGTAELLRSTVVGRHAATAAALLVAAGASLLVGLLDAAVLASAGLAWGDTIAHGLAMAGVGLAFTGVAGVASQVTSSARGALGIAGAVVAGLFVARGWGAARDSWLVWIAPFGWQEGVRPFGETRWWLLSSFVVCAAVLLALTAYLTSHRDFGAGLVQARAGRPRAARSLATSYGLAFRSQRGLFLGWAVGLTVLACVFGAFGREVVTIAESNPLFMDVIGGRTDDIVLGYFGFVMNFLCVVAAGYAVSSALRLRHDEDAGLAETLLSTGLSRMRWLLGGVAVTVLGTLVLLVLMGAGAGAVHALVTGDSGLVGPLLRASLGTAPAVLLLASVALLLHGVWPRAALFTWAPFAFSLVQAYLGELLDFPDWVAGLSPFWHLPLMPIEEFEAAPVLVIGGIALALALVGMLAVRRRDVGLG